MTNGNDAVHPKPVFKENMRGDIVPVGVTGGLTKREAFTMAAMQGLLSAVATKDFDSIELTKAAARIADEQITALNQSPESKTK